MARAAVLAGGASTLIVLGTELSDRISAWFMDSAVGSDPSRLAEAMVTIQLYAGPAGVGLLFLIGIIGMLGGLMMAFLMLLRTGILVLMAAALPIAGAAGGTKVGSQAYEKMLAWTIAFLLVKPVGAFVIGVSAILFLEATPTITDPENGDGFMALSGVITLCAAALVLPALMRLIVPNIGALGGGGSGLAAAAGLVGLLGGARKPPGWSPPEVPAARHPERDSLRRRRRVTTSHPAAVRAHSPPAHPLGGVRQVATPKAISKELRRAAAWLPKATARALPAALLRVVPAVPARAGPLTPAPMRLWRRGPATSSTEGASNSEQRADIQHLRQLAPTPQHRPARSHLRHLDRRDRRRRRRHHRGPVPRHDGRIAAGHPGDRLLHSPWSSPVTAAPATKGH
nr:hypothetical protein [Rhodococcus sp. p52]